MMKIYILSLAAGLAVGVFYGLLQVRSPAPPVVALVGLFGILVGEQIPPLVKGWMVRKPAAVSWLKHQVGPHMFGPLPCGQKPTELADNDPPAAPKA
ncbi:XapX domain-containing protein [Caulobacter radicis]|jgi:XapX domain-containing protein|nr:XapX domain-containing protein [Caulobacter radicis]